jgi:hypothetical protein
MLTDSEAVRVGRRFPALGVQPGGICLVRDTLLDRLFPRAAFYKTLDRGGRPAFPYLVSITGDSVFRVPSGFNLLLREQDIEVTDDNILDLARAFVIIALANGPLAEPVDEFTPLNFIPRITFLGGQRIEQRDLRHPFVVDAKITCRVGSDETQTWDFYQGRRSPSKGVWVKTGQFAAVRVAIDGKPVREYRPVNAEAETRRGAGVGSAQAERDSLGTGSASGIETEEGQEVKVSLRRLPNSEVMTIFDKYPETVSGEPAHPRGSEVLASLYPLSEVTAAPLKRAFPNVRFFKGLDTGILPPVPYVMATAGRKRYLPMPAGLNHLLVDSDVRVTDSNLVEIAKAVVVLALGNDRPGNPSDGGYVSDELLAFPKLTFLSAEMQVTGESHAAKFTVRVGDNEEGWYVPRWHDQLGWVSRGNANGFINDYEIPEAQPLQQRGQADYTPNAPEQKK